jgi:hypothetical protein
MIRSPVSAHRNRSIVVRARNLFPFGLAVLFAACASGPPREPDISGEYEIRTNVQGSSVTASIVLDKGETGYEGDISTSGFGSFPVSSVTREGDVWLIQSDTMGGLLVIEMYVEGESIRGTWSMAGDGGSFTGRRLEG